MRQTGLAWQVERIMQGNSESTWGLLTFLRKHHPKAKLAVQSDVVVVDGGKPLVVEGVTDDAIPVFPLSQHFACPVGNVMRTSVGTGESVTRSKDGQLTPRSSPPRQLWREVRLPYDHAMTCAVEQSLMNWIHSLGLVDVSRFINNNC